MAALNLLRGGFFFCLTGDIDPEVVSGYVFAKFFERSN